jgi:hypothetical protein
MSNYVKITDFASKDALATGNPLKLIKGTEINDELNAIQTAVGTKADLASPAFTGNPTSATQSFGNNSNRVATTAFVQSALAALYPIGSIYTSTASTNPNTLFGFGTWVAFGAGRVLVGVSGTAPYTAGATGGSADAVVVSHTHTATYTDSGHTHSVTQQGGRTGGAYQNGSNPDFRGESSAVLTTATGNANITTTVASAGVSGTNANLQPYVVVYMWNRTA